MDQYEELKFSQLAVAHRCSILFFTKDKFSNLGKKLRPEFDKLYLSSELKDCIKLLSSPVIEGGELHNPVDLVLLDYDPGAVRLVDFINKRTTNPQTRGCPIIPTIVIMAENNEREATEHIRTAGGVTKIVRQPFKTKDLLYTLLDVISTQKKVEETFRSLTRKKIISSKYPYMPIFDNPVAEAAAVAAQEAEQKELERTARKSLIRHCDHESVRSGTVSGSFISINMHEQKVEELEEGTECSSLLPDFVKRMRQENPELNSPYRQERLRDAAQAGNAEEERFQAEAAERLAWRTRLASRDAKDDGSLESGSVGAAEKDKDRADDAEVAASAPGGILMLGDTRRQGSTDPHADGLNYSSASLDKSSIASLVRKHQRAEEQGGFSVASSTVTATPQNKIQELLSASMRPVWLDAKPGANGKDARLEALARSRRENSKLAYRQVVDIRPFVNKPPPLVQRPSTVGGLDRRAAEAYWRAYKPTKGLGTRKDKSEPRFLAPSEAAIDLPTIDEHHHHGGSRSASAGFSGGTTKLFAPASPSHKGAGHGSAHSSTHTSASDLSNHLASFGMHDAGHQQHQHGQPLHTTATADGIASSSNEAFPMSPSDRGFRRSSHASMSTASQSKDYTTGMSTVPQMSPTRAEKRIVEMATEVAPDLQVSVLLEIDFSDRKINLGEKEMLMKGLRLEREGDLDAAISCYSRAGMHSKDPHIAKILVGNLHYKNEALMLALNFYTQAVQLLSSRTASTRLVTDEFIAYRNRGIINFRLGDDQSGISDLARAVDLMPQDIELRELISLAKRRVGKYAQAIQEATVAKTIRNERRRQELILEKQRDLIRKKQFLQSEKERNRQRVAGAGAGGTGGGGVVVYNASAKFTQFASRSSRHASVLSRSAAAAAAQMELQSVASDGELMGMSGKQTLFADSTTVKEDDINARLLQTRGYVLQIDEPRCLNSLRDRVAEGRKNLKKELENDQQHSEETFLRVFKMNNGYKADLFQDIFERPSELQGALLVPPERRTQEDMDVIITSLRLIPLLTKASSSVLSDLAKSVEYRAMTTKDVLFSQGDQSCAACFLLSGHVQVKMEKQSAGTAMVDIPIGDVPEYTTFGHIDFLFRNNNHRIMHEVEKIIRPRRALRRAAAAEGGEAQASAVVAGAVNHLHSPSTHHHKHHHHHHPGRSPGAGTTIEEGDEDADGDGDGSTDDHELATPMLTFAGPGGRGGSHVDRSLAPGMFKTYAIQSPCELLLLRENDFEKLLLQPALDDLRRRLDAIRSCGIFADWTPAQHVRLARMGIVKRVHKGDTILTQGHKPNFLYIILKGICVVQKQPNRTEMLVQKLTAAREKAAIFDSRYIFDHKLVTTLRMANLKDEFKAANVDNPEVAFTLADAKWNPDSILRQRNVTESELERYKLQLEINKLEALIHNAAMEDARDEDLNGNNFAAFAGLAGSRRFINSSNPSLNGGGTGNNSCTNTNNNTNNNTGAPVLELKVADIAHIQWPKIFGEACILDPENGRSRGSVVADTACEIFMLHKAQIQTFPVDDAFLSSVKVKAVAYPGDPDVVLSLYRKQEWKKFRAEVLDEIPKTRWLRGDEGVVKEPFRIN